MPDDQAIVRSLRRRRWALLFIAFGVPSVMNWYSVFEGYRQSTSYWNWTGAVTLLLNLLLLAAISYILSRKQIRRPVDDEKYQQRIAQGHCGVCDYDLSGIASNRCPECGSKIEAAPR